MSRIGRMPITVPAGVEVTIAENNVVTVKGPKGSLNSNYHPLMTVKGTSSAETTPSSLHPLSKRKLSFVAIR